MSEYEDYIPKKDFPYIPQSNEIEIAKACLELGYPLMLRGPTGVGKTTFVRYLAKLLNLPLITEPCNEDTTADTLIGSYNLEGWHDGSATFAFKAPDGAIYYLDEIGEARPEAIVVVHAATDDRRELEVRDLGKILHAHKKLFVVGSYNPGYQMQAKLKPSTLQRFVTLDYRFPDKKTEGRIMNELFEQKSSTQSITGRKMPTIDFDGDLQDLVLNLAQDYRRMASGGELREGPSTRLVKFALGLMKQGIPAYAAIEAALVNPLTFDPKQKQALLQGCIQKYAPIQGSDTIIPTKTKVKSESQPAKKKRRTISIKT